MHYWSSFSLPGHFPSRLRAVAAADAASRLPQAAQAAMPARIRCQIHREWPKLAFFSVAFFFTSEAEAEAVAFFF
jgi:hypothetical protein